MSKSIVYATAVFFGLVSASADAATVTATSIIPSTFTDFTIDFTDNGNGLLEFDEITSFSGITYFGESLFFDAIVRVPTISGISSGDFANWVFGGPTNAAVSNETWTYQTTAISAVPIPAALPLLASALSVIGFFGWRRKRAISVDAV